MAYRLENSSTIQENLKINLPIRRYTNMASAKILTFIDKCVRSLNYLENDGFEIDDLYYQRLSEFSDIISTKLTVNDYKTYQKIKSYINMAVVVADSGFNHKDPGSVISSFYGLKNNLNKLNVIKN
ncbi:MAG: hypothetical protein BZ137_01995 [Methanosphaera sp. rholeuAM130]|nr:MAG: hypothetical protein BZ137_01995 [Methanosphaera sp. rholeuAM130]